MSTGDRKWSAIDAAIGAIDAVVGAGIRANWC